MFQQAVETAQYVIQVLDKDPSGKAKELIENAKKQIQAKAQAKVEDVKDSLGDFGK